MRYQGSSAVEFKFLQADELPGPSPTLAAASIPAVPSESVPEQGRRPPTGKGLFGKVAGELSHLVKKKPGKAREAGVQSHPGSSREPNEFALTSIGDQAKASSFSDSTVSGECSSKLGNSGIARVVLNTRRSDYSTRHQQLSRRGE